MVKLELENFRAKVNANTWFKVAKVQCQYMKENEGKNNQLWLIASNVLK